MVETENPLGEEEQVEGDSGAQLKYAEAAEEVLVVGLSIEPEPMVETENPLGEEEQVEGDSGAQLKYADAAEEVLVVGLSIEPEPMVDNGFSVSTIGSGSM